MQIQEALQRIQSLYSRGVQSQNTRLSNRHIYNKLRTVRSTVVKQEFDKKQIINQWTYQTLPCIELIEVPLNECPCTLQTGCIILRSKYPIPSFMTGMDKHLVQSVTGLEGRVSFQETTYNQRKYNKGNRYSSELPDWFIRNVQDKSYIYITVNLRLEAITMTALFDNPINAWVFPSLCNTNIYTQCMSYLDMEFPIDNDLMDSVIKLAAEELINIFTQMKQDSSDNAIDDTARTSGQKQGE